MILKLPLSETNNPSGVDLYPSSCPSPTYPYPYSLSIALLCIHSFDLTFISSLAPHLRSVAVYPHTHTHTTQTHTRTLSNRHHIVENITKSKINKKHVLSIYMVTKPIQYNTIQSELPGVMMSQSRCRCFLNRTCAVVNLRRKHVEFSKAILSPSPSRKVTKSDFSEPAKN
jgi:hypothetical protein